MWSSIHNRSADACVTSVKSTRHKSLLSGNGSGCANCVAILTNESFVTTEPVNAEWIDARAGARSCVRQQPRGPRYKDRIASSVFVE